MTARQICKTLVAIMDDFNEMEKNHSAGAIVGHSSPFDALLSHRNNIQLSKEFAEKWVLPFYMKIGSPDSTWIDKIKSIKDEISEDVALSLLGDFNWRPRLVGSYFSAVKGYQSLVDIIGIHLLKSELCCVAHIYALTLAFFNNDKSVEYIDKYLTYYLTKPELYFDQGPVLEVMLYLDSINQTSFATQHMNAFNKMQNDRKSFEIHQSHATAKMIQELDPNFNANEYFDNIQKSSVILFDDIKFNKVESQISILKDLYTYCH